MMPYSSESFFSSNAGTAPAFSNFGKIALPDGAAPSENTVYEIGSITKEFTAAAIVKLCSERSDAAAAEA